MKFYTFKRKSIRTNKALILTTNASVDKNNISQVEPLSESEQSSATNSKNELSIPQANNKTNSNHVDNNNEQNVYLNNNNVNDDANNQNYKENVSEFTELSEVVPPEQLIKIEECDQHSTHDNELAILNKYDINITSDVNNENYKCETEITSETIVDNDYNKDNDDSNVNDPLLCDIVSEEDDDNDDDDYNIENDNLLNIKNNISAKQNLADNNANDEGKYDIELDQVHINNECNGDGDGDKIVVQHDNFCSKCSILFLSEDSFNEHIQSHSNNNITNENLENIIQIPIKINDTSDSDDYNEKKPINKICAECNKKFTKKSQYDHHLQMHKSTRLVADTFEYYPCHNCHILYINEQQLFEHIRVQHNSKDNEMCTDYQFLDEKTNFYEHIKYYCGICKSKYLKISELKQHIITHSENFICPYDDCGCQYKILSRLSNHIMEKHVYEHGQIHRCRYCDVDVFQSYDELQNHLKNNCTERKYKCSHCGKFTFYNYS